ncbi:unnamed protein product [Tilletia controversa]|uniref:TIP41-like protein n=2 Tax=Tilletia TaxID=13289 RepID=A0A177USQ7_9BASI|nr:hypothetical protein CF336_g7394 [Tilletia laevis]KAE8248389.1 hypothetical protein A4X03_0g6789 [Tilletia caries]CAD6898011.1 unnamed protein product [Tilletia controversa]KAE8188331.1 hypothetical protein CF335_g6927 [Tilletia laevis]CAD6904765.1 unnamed protein product [Tilletia laevis]
MHHFETTKPYLPGARHGAPQQPASAASVSVSASDPAGGEIGAGAQGKEPWRIFAHTFPASSPSGGGGGGGGQLGNNNSSQGGSGGIPEPAVNSTVPSVLSRGIQIAGWTITATKGPIASSAQMDSISSDFNIPPPEMLFPDNSLVIAHPQSGFSYTFDAVRALSSVHGVAPQHGLVGLDLREDYERAAAAAAATSGAGAHSSKLGSKPKSKGIKVAYAQEWGKSRTELPAGDLSNTARPGTTPVSADSGAQPTSGSFFGPGVAQAIASASIANATSDIASARDYDWTYSNTWPGAVNADQSDQISSTHPQFEPTSDPALDRIPIEKLGVGSEPILFYDEVVLYEDELADNGSSMLSVKVRVMPSGFLVLQRFLLRVDNVLFRMFDTRMYASFTPPSPSDSDGNSAPTPSISNTYTGTVRPTSRPTSIPTLEPGRLTDSSSPSTTTPLPQGMAKLSLGPTRRQMRENAAAAAESATGSAPSNAPSPIASTVSESQQTTSTSAVRGDDLADAATKASLRVIRECAGWAASYAEVKSRLPPYKAWDLSPLTDPNWISATLQSLDSRAPAGARSATPSPYYPGSANTPSYAALGAVGPGSNAQILGAVDEDKWEGVGSRADVALVPHIQPKEG